MKKYLIILQQDPYKNSLALEGLEFALAVCSFEQEVALLIKGDGVKQLMANQDPDNLVAKDFTKIYSGINLFGIEKIYLEQGSADNAANFALAVTPQFLNAKQIDDLVHDYDVVITI